jgi:hypothetical protein
MRTEAPATKRNYPETQEVEAFVKWFRLQHPQILIYKNQNEGKRRPWLAKKLGILAGIPDLHIIKSVGKWHSYYIEMKLPDGKGVLSPMQKTVITRLIEADHAVDVAHGWEDAMRKTHDYLNGHYMPLLISQSFDASV